MLPESRDKLKGMLSKDSRFDDYSPTEIDQDIIYFVDKLQLTLSFFVTLTEERKIAIVYLCFILGVHNFLQLKHIIGYIANGEFTKAANELLSLDLLAQAKRYLDVLGDILMTGQLV
jgi:GH24 family phage-related lysozyme (muramidase)